MYALCWSKWRSASTLSSMTSRSGVRFPVLPQARTDKDKPYGFGKFSSSSWSQFGSKSRPHLLQIEAYKSGLHSRIQDTQQNPGYTAESRIHNRIKHTQQNPRYTAAKPRIHSRTQDTQQNPGNPGYMADPKVRRATSNHFSVAISTQIVACSPPKFAHASTLSPCSLPSRCACPRRCPKTSWEKFVPTDSRIAVSIVSL